MHVRCPGFAWSADGKKLYVSNIPKDKLRVADNVDQVVPVCTRVYDLEKKTDSATDIPEGHIVSDVAPDGKSVLTTVQVWDPMAERLTNHLVALDTFKPVALGKEGLFEPRFSPDGTKVIGVRGPVNSSDKKGLFIFDIAKKEEARVALPKEYDEVPMTRACWSPDGKRILFQWQRQGGPHPVGAGGAPGAAQIGHVAIANIDGSNVKQIAADNGAGELLTGIEWK
jgi:Tol biopolymer transport system component